MLLGIKFSDGNEFISYNDDTECYRGCPTCNYGSEYINDISIETTHYKIKIIFNQMYDYACSTADVIKMFAVDLRGMNENEFIEYIKKEFYNIDTPEKFEVVAKEE